MLAKDKKKGTRPSGLIKDKLTVNFNTLSKNSLGNINNVMLIPNSVRNGSSNILAQSQATHNNSNYFSHNTQVNHVNSKSNLISRKTTFTSSKNSLKLTQKNKSDFNLIIQRRSSSNAGKVKMNQNFDSFVKVPETKKSNVKRSTLFSNTSNGSFSQSMRMGANNGGNKHQNYDGFSNLPKRALMREINSLSSLNGSACNMSKTVEVLDDVVVLNTDSDQMHYNYIRNTIKYHPNPSNNFEKKEEKENMANAVKVLNNTTNSTNSNFSNNNLININATNAQSKLKDKVSHIRLYSKTKVTPAILIEEINLNDVNPTSNHNVKHSIEIMSPKNSKINSFKPQGLFFSKNIKMPTQKLLNKKLNLKQNEINLIKRIDNNNNKEKTVESGSNKIVAGNNFNKKSKVSLERDKIVTNQMNQIKQSKQMGLLNKKNVKLNINDLNNYHNNVYNLNSKASINSKTSINSKAPRTNKQSFLETTEFTNRTSHVDLYDQSYPYYPHGYALTENILITDNSEPDAPFDKHQDYRNKQQLIHAAIKIPSNLNASQKEKEYDRVFNSKTEEDEENEEDNIKDIEGPHRNKSSSSFNSSAEDKHLNLEDSAKNESGVLTFDEVKDIIMCIDFKDYPMKEKHLFYKSDYDMFNSDVRAKYMNSLFNSRNSFDLILNTNYSSSTKDSSSNKKNFTSVIKILDTQ